MKTAMRVVEISIIAYVIIMVILLYHDRKDLITQNQQLMDIATKQSVLLKNPPPLPIPNLTKSCSAWWFGKGSVKEVKQQICGRK